MSNASNDHPHDQNQLRQLPVADPHAFAEARHIGPSGQDIEAMLAALGLPTLDTLIDQTVPKSIRQETPLDLGLPAHSEHQIMKRLRTMADKNQVMTNMIGLGYHGTLTPPVIQRCILENPAWYTAYTPYQAEISQGRMEALLNFQTMVADLAGLEIANASLLDEPTAAAEGMALAHKAGKAKSDLFFVDQAVLPQTLAVIKTRAETLGWQVQVGDPLSDLDASKVFGALFQYPAMNGEIRDYRAAIEALHTAKALAVFAADPLALTVLASPGELGADIVVGSMQRFGVPMGFGGPHAGFMATKDAFKRNMPGRLIGVSKDARGRSAYRLTLQAREQHIRREKATSNICTAQVLLAVMSSMYGVYHGPRGLSAIAHKVHAMAARLGAALGDRLVNASYFDTLLVRVEDADATMADAVAQRINLRKVRSDQVALTFDESHDAATLEALAQVFGVTLPAEAASALPSDLLRQTDFMTHPVFNQSPSEADLTRYMRALADKDYALDRGMIPLGSCTMKLNAAAEMMPISYAGFAHIHPFQPAEQTQGYAQLIDELSDFLCRITGYDAICMQPNSGAQGEYAGLLAIRAYHEAQGDTDRRICLIPASAHGTNPASAHMAGMDVVIVASDAKGNIDVEDFRTKAEAAGSSLAACMITYPSTHGVFEEQVRELCDITHQFGGQVYLDGANLNAQVGLSRPGDYGADVGHLNLHKTFAIPHGGGGPGMGPIGVAAHLAPYVPGHPMDDRLTNYGPVNGAPYGSGSVLPISYAYIAMMGSEGLTQATKIAILNANYIAERLQPHFPVLYRGRQGRVAHECILDTRPALDAAGLTVDDLAKRLMDYGFHAPTMSWPVAGTLMIEPTESESLKELDRFCEAMIAIKAEIDAVSAGRYSAEDSPLRHAPHTMDDLVGDWDRPYSREEAVFPMGRPGGLMAPLKYWPPVSRVDNTFGDRHVVCACPPIEDYM